MQLSEKKPTIKDVAREAGVSVGTVSKVLNGVYVSEPYTSRVKTAISALDYRINYSARALRTDKTRVIALIIPGTDDMFFALLANSVCNALAKRDYRMILATTKFDQRGEARCLEMARDNKVDGIIGLTYSAELSIDPDIPYVSIDRFIAPGIPCVTSDNYGGGFMAAEKLLSLGCERPLFLRNGSSVPGEVDKRREGFAACCRAYGVQYESLFLNDGGFDRFTRFLAEHTHRGQLDFDGIFCNTDTLAMYIIERLHRMGVAVPEQVQVIGFDGIQRFFTEGYFCSTIVQPVPQIAETAVNLLLSDDQPPAALTCLPVAYAAGGTTREPIDPEGN